MSHRRATHFGRGIPPSPGSLGWGTWALLGLAAGPYLIAWLALRGVFVGLFGLALETFTKAPWGIITFPLATPGSPGEILGVLFTCLWVYFLGRSLEDDLGSGLMLALFGGLTLVSSAAWLLGSLAINAGPLLAGLSLPLAAMTVVWAMRNQEQSILFMMIIPLKAKYLAILVAVITLFTAGAASPFMGVFALIPLGVGLLYATNRLPGLRYGATPADSAYKKKNNEEFLRFQDEVRKKEKEREERERLRKLFEASLRDDDDSKRKPD